MLIIGSCDRLFATLPGGRRAQITGAGTTRIPAHS